MNIPGRWRVVLFFNFLKSNWGWICVAVPARAGFVTFLLHLLTKEVKSIIHTRT